MWSNDNFNFPLGRIIITLSCVMLCNMVNRKKIRTKISKLGSGSTQKLDSKQQYSNNWMKHKHTSEVQLQNNNNTKRQNDLFSYCCSANYLELNFYYSDLVYHDTTHEPEYTLMSIMGKWELHTRSALVNLCDYTSVCMPVHRRTC